MAMNRYQANSNAFNTYQQVAIAHPRVRGSYGLFDRGREAVGSIAARPCCPQFVDTLLADFDLWYTCLVLSGPLPLQHEKPSFLAQEAMKHLSEIMAECRRLHLHPELFSSPSLRSRFLKMISAMSAEAIKLKDVLAMVQDFEMKVIASVHGAEKPLLVKKVAGVWFQTRNPEAPKLLPELHPHGPSRRNPWNKWLDNCHSQQSGQANYVRIRQQVPLVGIKILRRTRFMYGIVRRSYVTAKRVIHDPKDATKLSAATGEDYSLLYQRTNVQMRAKLGFETGGRKYYDSNGVMTLECLSVALRRFQRRLFNENVSVLPVCTIGRA